MKRIIQALMALFVTLLISGCGPAKLSPEQQSLIDAQTPLYTQVPMWEEKDRVYGTNYSRGALIPINSKVTLLKATSKAVVFDYNGRKITYLITPQHTKADAATIITRLFGKKPVKLSKYKHAKYIKQNRIVKGMTKDEVLLARGYPPFHRTPSLKSDEWVYWYHRFSSAYVRFNKGKVVETRGRL